MNTSAISPRKTINSVPSRPIPSDQAGKRDGDAPSGFRRQSRLRVGRWVTAILLRLPLPSEVKWQYVLDLIKTLTVECYQDLNKTLPEAEARSMVARALYASGRKWIVSLGKNHKDSSNDLASMGDMINRVFRALDIDTSIRVGSGEVRIINHRCPYLEHGTALGVPGDKICPMICGLGTSLVEGINDGFARAVRYRPEDMMGKGQATCVKRFSLGNRARHLAGGLPSVEVQLGQGASGPARPSGLLRAPVRLPALPPHDSPPQDEIKKRTGQKPRRQHSRAAVDSDSVGGAGVPALDHSTDPEGHAIRTRAHRVSRTSPKD